MIKKRCSVLIGSRCTDPPVVMRVAPIKSGVILLCKFHHWLELNAIKEHKLYPPSYVAVDVPERSKFEMRGTYA